MIKKRLILWIFVLMTTIAKADYGYMSLSKTILKAENCVVGEIVDLDLDFIYFRVDSLVFGEVESDTLKVIRFYNWNCGRRYAEYKIGQKEVLYYNKTNHLIEDYELYGYGGGCEYEQAIVSDSIVSFQFRFNRFKEYKLNDYVQAVKEYKALSLRGYPLTEEEVEHFRIKSVVHEHLIRRNNLKQVDPLSTQEDKKEMVSGIIKNAATNFLYDGYNNALDVYVDGVSFEDLILKVDDAKVFKKDGQFIVKPSEGWSKRRIVVYKLVDGDTLEVTSDLFKIYPLPQSTICINESKGDSINRRYLSTLRLGVNHNLGLWHSDDKLKCKILKYSAEISQGPIKQTFHMNFSGKTQSFKKALRQLQPRDKIRFYNITVLYPEGSIHTLLGKTFYVK